MQPGPQPLSRFRSITAKISAMMLLVSLVPMAGISFYNLKRSEDVLKQAELENLQLLAMGAAHRLDQLLLDSQQTTIAISKVPVIESFLAASPSASKQTRSSVTQLLSNYQKSNPDYQIISLVGVSGEVLLSSSPELIGANLDFRSYFQEALRGKNSISTLLISQVIKRPGVFFASPVRQDGGKIVGVVVVQLRAQALSKIMDQVKQIKLGTHSFVVDQVGLIIAHSNPDLLYHSLTTLPADVEAQLIAQGRVGLKSIPSLNVPDLASAILGQTKPGNLTYNFPQEGGLRILGYSPLQIQPWVVAISVPQVEFMVPLHLLAEQNNFSLLLVAIATVILSLFLSRKITKPIRSLTTAAKALEKNQFEAGILLQEQDRQDDMGQLTRVFLNMATQVQQREAKLKQQVQELKIEIDQEKRVRQVAEITETDYFQELRQRAKDLRKRNSSSGDKTTGAE